MRIPVSSPYIEVHMDTSGPYALVKARTIFPGSAHPHDTQVTRTLYTPCTRLNSTVYARTLRAQFPRHVQDYKHTLRAYNLRPHLRAQSMLANYVYNLRAQLTRTTYVFVLRAHVTRTTFTQKLRVQLTSQFGAHVLYDVVWRARIYY